MFYRNGEGYYSPTEGEALGNIVREEKREAKQALRDILSSGMLVNEAIEEDGVCFAFIPEEQRTSGTGCCKATENVLCPGCECCSYYKTRTQYVASLRAANERLRSLPYGKQIHIAEKYYSGVMPWRYEDEKAR